MRAERTSDRPCPHCGFDGVPSNQPPFLPEGTAVGGRYVLGRQEGHGGFSICYRAWDSLTNEMVAIKELFPWEVAERLDTGRVGIDPRHKNDFDMAVNCLSHEGEVLRKLTSDLGIVRVGDVFNDNDTAYLPMEFLRGQSYEKYLRSRYAKSLIHLDVETAVNVALTILDALAAVHARGLLHLDVKPANIRVLDDGHVVLLDFGSARDAFRQGVGLYGDTFTPGFAALEQHYASGSVTPATDVYGLAATLYYSLSLTVPTRADDRQNGAELVPLSESNPAVPQKLDAIVQKAMALSPQGRYPSVKLLKHDLSADIVPPQPPTQLSSLAAPISLRIAAGLFDVVTDLLLLSALMAAQQVSTEPGQIVATGLLIWWIIQLLPLATSGTPGMLLMGLRLADQSGSTITLSTLLSRTIMLIVTFITLRFRPNSQGLLLHDSVSGSRVVIK